MKKTLLACLGLAMASTLSGCMLYFGEEHHGDMGPPGTYESYDDWGNPVCVPGGGDGYYCSTDQQCASGCYCDETSGTCVEAGFCSTDAERPAGNPTLRSGVFSTTMPRGSTSLRSSSASRPAR